MNRPARASWLCGIVLLLAGCSRSVTVTVEATVPAAAVDRLPLTVAVVYEPAFSGHVYREDTEDRPHWSIDTGASQVWVFDRVFNAMFGSVVSTAEAAAVPAADLVLHPHIDAMQFSMPHETGFGFFEVWVSYRIEVLDSAGVRVANWTVNAYGKAAAEKFTSRTDSILAAMQLAFRDAGAKITTGFANEPDIERWLRDRTP